MLNSSDDKDSLRAERLIEELGELQNVVCSACEKLICGHEALIGIALGYKGMPKCAGCLAAEQHDLTENIRDRLFMYIYARPCFRTAWHWASKNEGFQTDGFPKCLWPSDPVLVQKTKKEHSQDRSEANAMPLHIDSEWDAGDMGCGDLVLELRIRLQAMSSGQILKVVARDPGAPEDMPAWCRLTGHTLLSASHPQYVIKRKEQ